MKAHSLFSVIGLAFLAGSCFAAAAFAYEVGGILMVDPFGSNKTFESAKVIAKEARGYEVRLLPGNKHTGEYFVPETWISGMGSAPETATPGVSHDAAPTKTGAAQLAAPHTTPHSQHGQWQSAANDPYKKNVQRHK